MVMDSSWGWVKPGSVTTTEPRAKAMLELARLAIPQAMRHPIVGTRPELVERRGPGSDQPLRVAAVAAVRWGPPGPGFVCPRREPSSPCAGASDKGGRALFVSTP